jgi:uncharacterized protein involved in response to NO
MIEIKPCGPGEAPVAKSGLGPFLSLGFRPFFLGATAAGLLLMAGWVWSLLVGQSLSAHYGFLGWHAHEMIFGYSVAAITGFLLTAVHNWTDLPTAHGPKLAALFGLWLAGRLVGLMPFLPGPFIALIDLAFLPALGWVLFTPLMAKDKGGNPIFLGLIALLTVANGLVHLDALGWATGTRSIGLTMGINTILLIITAIGGRVIPMFTQRAFPGSGTRSYPIIERLTIGSMALLLVAEALSVPTVAIAALAAVAAVAQLIRLAGWHQKGLWRVPLLWVLYCGYGWLVLGLALKALALLGLLPLGAATHALTVGAIGVLTVGIMTRVTLGHTGRPMAAEPLVAMTFGLLIITAFARVGLAVVSPANWQIPMALTGTLWAVAFAILLWIFTPMWLGPEGD